ncbi:MAG: cobalamin-dependent protein [Elusimicrobiota bacterium]|nr:cobalamin-dependent protein [Elusimicrobiota bacterium]
MSGRVALAGVIGYGYGNLAASCLRDWALRDPALAASVEIECFEFPSGSSPREAARALLASRPALVGLSCYLWTSEQVFAICDELERLSPDTTVLVGGPDVASLPEETLRARPSVDLVACGEGEETFRRLLRCLFLGDGELAAVPGLALRRDGGVLKTAPAELIDLACAPPVYAGSARIPSTHALLESSRGCPFLCTFCDWGPRKMRYLPLERLEAEFRALAARVRWIHLCDADLLMDKKRGLAVMEMFLRAAEGTACTLKFDTNPAFLHREAADLIARDPMKFYVTLGLQTTNPAAIAFTHRQLDLPRVEGNLAYLASVAPGAQILMSIIFGLPADDLAGFRSTLDWCFRWRFDRIGACQLLLIPGSDLARDAAATGVSHQAAPPYQVTRTATMSPREMSAARELAYHAEFLGSVKPLLAAVQDACAAAPRGPGERVALFEDWIGYLRRRGFDLTFGAPVSETDGMRVEERLNEPLRRLREDKLLLASLIQATRAFAESRGARPASGAAPAAAIAPMREA